MRRGKHSLERMVHSDNARRIVRRRNASRPQAVSSRERIRPNLAFIGVSAKNVDASPFAQ